MSQQNPNQQLQQGGPSQSLTITPQDREIAHVALERLLDSGIGGSTHDPNVAASFMELAGAKHILLSPLLGAFRMRPGWELAFTKLKVNTSKEAKMVYKVSGGDDDDRGWGDGTPLAFHKPLLYIIRTHLGIDIDDIVRVDDGKKEFCREYKVFAHYQGVDGQVRTLVDQGGLDLSDNSPAYNKILAETRGNNPEEKRRKGLEAIERVRAKLVQRATTNAEERVIQSYGFRGSYTKGELDSKYIVCVRPLETGYHPDPEMQKLLLTHMLQRQNQATSMLFGPGSNAVPPTKSLPPIDDAAVAAYASAMEPEGKLSTGGEPSAESPKQCTPDHCFVKDCNHVRACYETVASSSAQTTQTTENPSTVWVIDVGEKSGMRVDDPQVTIEDLNALLNHYKFMSSGGNLPTEAVSKMMADKEAVTNEIERRKNLK